MGDDISYEEVTIRVKKVSYLGKPTHWEVDIEGQDLDGCGATGPTFASVFDSAYEIISGISGDYFDQPNPWVDFDSNKRSNT